MKKDVFIARLESCLSGLPDAERREILDETRSHLEDCASQGEESLMAALKGFGPPERYARAFIEEAQLRDALVSGTPVKLVLGILSLAGRSILAFCSFILIAFGYLFAGTFFLLVIVELMLPAQTGLFTGPHVQPFALGVMAGSGPPPGTTEHLGAFMAPVMAVAGGVTTVLTLLFSRLVVARLLMRS